MATTGSIESARAAFTDAFQFPGRTVNPMLPQVIERDRLIMAARPGLIRKLLPLRHDDAGVYCGGCYLFDTFENATAFADWAEHEFVLDGVHFLDRAPFLEPSLQLWQVVGTADFAEVTRDQEIMRFERWHLGGPGDSAELQRAWWPKIRKQAEADGDATVWLLLGGDEFHPQLGLVTARCRSDPERRGATPPDVTELEGRDSLGVELATALDATKVFDRTSWVYTVWHPIVEGDSSPDTAQWPCSPPLPGLSA